MSSDDFRKVVDVSLTLALAPAFLKVAHDSVERIEGFMELTANSDSTEAGVDRAFVRHGFLLLAIAHIEDALREGCDDLSLLCPTTLRWKDIAGHSEFEKCQKYLRKALKLNLPSNAAWSTLKSYREARNAIAHCGRLSFSEDDERSALVRGLPGVDAERAHVFVLNRTFCAHLLNFGSSFMSELHQAAVGLWDAASGGARPTSR